MTYLPYMIATIRRHTGLLPWLDGMQLTCRLTGLSTYWPIYLLTYLPIYLPTYLPTYLHTYLHTLTC